MTCYVCKHDWCWTCGLSRRHPFHRIQLISNETGIVCELINNIANNSGERDRMCIKSLPIRYFLMFIVCIIAPPLLLTGAIFVGVLSYPVLPLAFVCCGDGHRCAKKIKLIWLKIPVLILFTIFLYVPLAIAGVFGLIGCCLVIVLFYLIGLVLIFRMFFVQCCRSRSVDNS